MRQLVGLKCSRCDKSIPNVYNSHFCVECDCPVHNFCAGPNKDQANTCRTCGSSLEVAEIHQQKEKEEAAKHKTAIGSPRQLRAFDRGIRQIYIGVGLMVGGVAVSALCCAASNGGSYVVATGAIAVGLGQIIYGVALLMKREPPEV